ncbi:phage major capsid protein [Metabacillus litoralis]|uniref:phage major capsid protein n=1 Tax=Metabacillus litoralis TaxID=152268 RepID=UPI00203AD7D3|nr:phage major capsid protein [Metabacillus litoralis]MCM3411884.1 phage major capsid protein [Metabacillus litoralis]
MENQLNKMELRTIDVELKSEHQESGELLVSGYVNQTSQWSQPLGREKRFVERIMPGTFSRALDKGNDIHFLAEHDNAKLLASTKNGSLSLREDDNGLYMEARISPTSWGKDYHQLIKDGLLTNMSFGMQVAQDKWEKRSDGTYERTISDITLAEVSVVRNPAYIQSTIQARSLEVISEDESFFMQKNQNSIPQEENKMEKILSEKEIREKEIELEKAKEARAQQLGSAQTVETRAEVVNQKEVEFRGVDQFLRQQNGEELRTIKTDAAPGQLTIPTHLSNLIVEKLYERAPIFSRTRNFTPVNGFLEILKEGSHGTAGFVGEMEPLAANDFSLSKVKLDQKRVGTAIELSQHMINDSGIDIINYAVNMMTKRLGQTIDANVLNGVKENGQFEGILTTAITSIDKVTAASGTKIETDELLDLYNSMNPEYIGDAVWVVSRATFNMISKLKDGNGQYFLVKEFATTGPVYSILGRPVLIQEAMPAHQAGRGRTVIFANFGEGYATMTKKGLTFKRIADDTTQALRGSQLLMLDGYMDGKILNDDAIRCLKAPTA